MLVSRHGAMLSAPQQNDRYKMSFLKDAPSEKNEEVDRKIVLDYFFRCAPRIVDARDDKVCLISSQCWCVYFWFIALVSRNVEFPNQKEISIFLVTFSRFEMYRRDQSKVDPIFFLFSLATEKLKNWFFNNKFPSFHWDIHYLLASHRVCFPVLDACIRFSSGLSLSRISYLHALRAKCDWCDQELWMCVNIQGNGAKTGGGAKGATHKKGKEKLVFIVHSFGL